MKKFTFVIVGLLFAGWGCSVTEPVLNTPETGSVTTTDAAGPDFANDSAQVTTTAIIAKPLVNRAFTLEEIEAKGGLKNWFRDLARANVAGKKTLVRVPVNHVFGFGCVSPTAYCVSTETAGCFGPFVDLKGDFATIKKSASQCDAICKAADDGRCTQEFRNNQCSTLWDVEGYVTAASRLPEAKDDGTPGTCADGELMYDFQVTRVINKIDGGYNEGFEFVEYSVE